MKSILITGASAGIGKGVAQAFLADGWRVGLLARSADKLQAVAQGHENARVLVADVTDATAVNAAFADFVAWAGRLDVLFNNAGMFGPAGSIDQVQDADWQQVVDVNLNGMFYCARAAFAQMRVQFEQAEQAGQSGQGGGRIINNGSISAHVPREGALSYTVTKHAITGMTRQLSLDGRAFDIACGQIDIGNAHTDLLDALIAKDPRNAPPVMNVDDVVDGLRYMAGLPLSANVQFMTVMATKMPYIGRG